MCLQPGDILHQRYNIVSELGRGGFARTYTAIDLDIPDDRLFVVKEIRQPSAPQLLPEARNRFEIEVRALHRLGGHSQIPQLFDSFQENDKFYLIQEYIEGDTLREEFDQNTQWNETQVIDFLQDILPVIAFVHEHNVIHRDITPSNLIRRDGDGRIVLIDFGAVKEISSLEITDSGQTISRTIYTRGYAPAEQLVGNPQRCSDIYAVGIVAIEGLTGLHPPQNFIINSVQDDIFLHNANSARPLIQISDDLKAILNRMVRYNFTTERYQCVAALLEDLNSIATLQSPPVSLSQNLNVPESLSANQPGSQSLTPKQTWFSRSHFRRLLGMAGIMAGIAIALFLHNALTPKTCLLVQGDALSCGEESLLKSSNPRLKQNGINEFGKSNYREAFNFFKRSWSEEERKDPETLIYMNNAFLKAKKADYHTIAVIIPVRTNEKGRAEIDLPKEILRGVAQAQTEVNLKLFNTEIDRNLSGLDFQENQDIKGKGLQVIIADDANLKEEAIARANSLVKLTGVLGAIGHYTNQTTAHTVDIYNQNHLVLISPGSTTEEVTEKRREFFFRTVPRTKVSVAVFTKYLSEKQGQTKLTGFYNSSSESTSTFWEEFRKQFRERGGTIANITEFDLSKSDFDVKKAIQEVRQTGQIEKTTIVISPSHVPIAVKNAMALFQANQDRNWVVGTGGIYGQKTLEAASQLPSFEKFAAAVSWHPLNSPSPKFLEDTRKLWEGNVSHRTALTYDAAKTLMQAIEKQQQPSREGMQQIIANPDFKADGATGTIQFDTTGERQNFSPKLVHIVKCSKEQFGVTFVPIEFPTAAAAGLKCD
jgi:eukaryotic-like serine/threonine-protein kinase